MDSTIYVEKRKALIRCAVTAHLICAFVLPYAKIRSSHDKAYIQKIYDHQKLIFLQFKQIDITVENAFQNDIDIDNRHRRDQTPLDLHCLLGSFFSAYVDAE